MGATASQALVVSAETAGLGNRIKSWVSAMRLGADVRVHWAINANMPAGFRQLFAADCSVDSIPAEATVYKSWRLLVLAEDEPYLPAGFATVGAGAHPLIRGLGKAWWNLLGQPSDRYRYMLFPKSHSRRSTRADARHIDLEYERIPEYFRRVYGPLFQKIAVCPQILQQVDDWARANLDDGVIGVQVRTWRDDRRRQRKYYRPAVKRLAQLMNAAESADRFFIVSDSDDVVAALRTEYGGGRVLDFPRQTSRLESWRSVDGITEDLIDMLLLARTQRLFASYLSTFSEAAWWLGGARARVWVF
jgi:hypothetical protein